MNALSHLLSLKADHNLLTSAHLKEVKAPPTHPHTHTHTPPPPPLMAPSSSTLQLQYLQVASFAHNKITSTEGIAHPMLETLNLACKSCAHCTAVCRYTLVSRSLPSFHCLVYHMTSHNWGPRLRDHSIHHVTCSLSQQHYRSVWPDTANSPQSTST